VTSPQVLLFNFLPFTKKPMAAVSDLRSGEGRMRVRGRVSSSLELLERTCPVTLDAPTDPRTNNSVADSSQGYSSSSVFGFGSQCQSNNFSSATSIDGAGEGESVATYPRSFRPKFNRTNSILAAKRAGGEEEEEEEKFPDSNLLLTVDEARGIISTLYLHSFKNYLGFANISHVDMNIDGGVVADVGHVVRGDGTATSIGRTRTYPEEAANIAREFRDAFMRGQRPVLALRPEMQQFAPAADADPLYLGIARGFQP